MSGIADNIIGKRKDFGIDGIYQCLKIAARQISAANRPLEESVSTEEKFIGEEADPTRSMTRSRQYFEFNTGDLDGFIVR